MVKIAGRGDRRLEAKISRDRFSAEDAGTRHRRRFTSRPAALPKSSRIVTLPSNHFLRCRIRNSLGSSPPLTSRARYQRRKPQRDSQQKEERARGVAPQVRLSAADVSSPIRIDPTERPSTLSIVMPMRV
jgi:hypothetical protein